MTGNTRGRLSEGHRSSDSKVSMYPRAEEVWGRVLPDATGPESAETFEVRVERAWVHLKGAFFSADEHERLRNVLASLIATESKGVVYER
jgi:hypothetical protein